MFSGAKISNSPQTKKQIHTIYYYSCRFVPIRVDSCRFVSIRVNSSQFESIRVDPCSLLFQHLLDFLHHRFHAIPADDGFDELAFVVVDEVVWDGIVV